jgi:selenoprotein W-related protein
MAAPRVVIEYCPKCGWLLRATWLAQELLTTFSEELGELALKPAEPGKFCIWVDGEMVWERKRDGGFPQAAQLKRLVQPRVAPNKPLGHSSE